MRVVALVQCTAGDLNGSRDEHDYVIGVCKRSMLFDSIALACPDEPQSRELEKLADDWGINCYRGDEFNIANRLLDAALHENAGIVVRVLLRQFYLDVEQVSRMVAALLDNDASYVLLPSNYNHALAADVCTREALASALREIEALNDPLEQASFRFSPWIFIESHPQRFPAVLVEGGPVYPAEKTKALRAKYRRVFSENQSHFSWRFPASSYKFLCSYLSSDWTVLDVACGKGQGSRCLKDYSARVVGVDIDEQNIRSANTSFGNIDELQFLVGDAECFIQQDNYDAVVSMHTLEHLGNPDAFFKCVHSNLREQGKLYLEVPLLLDHPLKMPLVPWHQKEYLLPELVEQVRMNGFVIDEIWVKQRHVFRKMPIDNNNDLQNLPPKSSAGLILATKYK